MPYQIYVVHLAHLETSKYLVFQNMFLSVSNKFRLKIEIVEIYFTSTYVLENMLD